jgi:hypothetical protein
VFAPKKILIYLITNVLNVDILIFGTRSQTHVRVVLLHIYMIKISSDVFALQIYLLIQESNVFFVKRPYIGTSTLNHAFHVKRVPCSIEITNPVYHVHSKDL